MLSFSGSDFEFGLPAFCIATILVFLLLQLLVNLISKRKPIRHIPVYLTVCLLLCAPLAYFDVIGGSDGGWIDTSTLEAILYCILSASAFIGTVLGKGVWTMLRGRAQAG